MQPSRAAQPFVTNLAARWKSANSLLCVGLDPDPDRFPAHLRGQADAIFQFCKAIVDATADLACAFKPQIAYFASHRAEDQLESLIEYIKTGYPDVPVILDAKRGDIGSTAEHYAREVFERYGADAATLSPYMGFDSIAPYLAYPDKGAIILCRTSNPGGSDVQFLDCGGTKVYQQVARLVANQWNANGQCGLVVGATFPDELAQVRAIAPELPLLIPGIGAQGGDVAATVRAGATPDGGVMISSSRAILYASDKEDFALRARDVALTTRDLINSYR
jgi:orotidine-5'-phosphate decarboxylase